MWFYWKRGNCSHLSLKRRMTYSLHNTIEKGSKYSKHFRTVSQLNGLLYFKKDFIYSFLERGEGRERNISVREKHPSVASPTLPRPITQACALTGNRISDLSVRRPPLIPLSHTIQGFLLLLLIQ